MSAHQKGVMVTDRGGMNHRVTGVRAGATTPSSRRVSPNRQDRLFYGSIAVALALTVFVGFGPTYLFPIFTGSAQATLTGGPVTPLVHVHAALFSAWVLLFIAQTTLVAKRKLAVHRRLGIAGGVLAVLMVVVGTLTALKKSARGEAPAGIDPLQFLMIPLKSSPLA